MAGIRQIEHHNIDVVNNMVRKTTLEKFHSSLVIDIEVSMLSKNSTAVINHLARLYRK